MIEKNNGDQFKIGRLYGMLDGISAEMQSIKKSSTKELEELKIINQIEHKEIREKLENLLTWKWKTLGFVSGIWIIFTILWTFVDKVLKI